MFAGANIADQFDSDSRLSVLYEEDTLIILVYFF